MSDEEVDYCDSHDCDSLDDDDTLEYIDSDEADYLNYEVWDEDYIPPSGGDY